MQSLLHACNIISNMSKTPFVAVSVNLHAPRPIKGYTVLSCGVGTLKLY